MQIELRASVTIHVIVRSRASCSTGSPGASPIRHHRPGSATSTHHQRGSNILLFVRRTAKSAVAQLLYMFLGPADYVSHERERPIAFRWRLRRPMPADFFKEAKVAAGWPVEDQIHIGVHVVIADARERRHVRDPFGGIGADEAIRVARQ
jgi:hypothetical protein